MDGEPSLGNLQQAGSAMADPGTGASAVGRPNARGTRLDPAGGFADRSARGYPEHGVFVVRHGDRWRAWRDACPHYGTTPLAWRRDAYLNADGSRIICAAHGAQFEPETGLCVLGPCLGQALTPVPLRITVDGDLEIEHPLSQELPR